MDKEIEDLIKDIKKLKEALVFYSDRSNYGKEEVREGLWIHYSAMGINFSNISHDDGEIARKVLEETK